MPSARQTAHSVVARATRGLSGQGNLRRYPTWLTKGAHHGHFIVEPWMFNAAIAENPYAPEAAFTELYRELAPALISFCNRILKSESSASDATHEAFARVLAHQPVLASKADFSRYMYRVALNVCLNELRRTRTISQEELPMWEPEVGNGEAGEVDRLVVHRILSRCDENIRTAAVLCFVEEHGCDETAAMLGCSRRSLYNWLRRFKLIAQRVLKDPPRPKKGASALHRA